VRQSACSPHSIVESIALLVLLDAFRPDYLWRTEFLRDLARRAAVGAMEEPFGFLPRASYFGGLTPNETGYSNIFAREPWRSPFPCVPDVDRVLAYADAATMRTRIVDEARQRLSDFGGRYADGFAIPTRELSSYAIAEATPPWGPRCGYRSLFHILDEAGLPWVQCSWPYTRAVAGADAGIVASFLDQLSEETRFGFVHLSQLDAVGHESGPGSAAMRDALEDIDRLCAVLYTRAHERFDRVRMLFFGDHGMVTVVRTIDLLEELRGRALQPGRDFDLFLDSPMARFWFRSGVKRDEVTSVLRRFDFGRVLDAHDLARFDADRMHPSNGELLFVAHPGIVFSPNAFQDSAVQVRGMHGYLPDVPDNRGLLLSYDSADRTPRSIGVAQATQIFPACLRMCGLDPAEHTTVPPLREEPAPRRWTTAGILAHEARVSDDLVRARAAIASRAPASAIAVTGSFGRGEGGVVSGAHGVEVLNDYDFMVIGPDAGNAAGLGTQLAASLGTDFCDVMPLTSAAGLPPSQLHFDLRYGGRVIAGDPCALDRIPAFAPSDISLRDAARLLMNRIAGVMLVPLPEQRGHEALTQFAVNQLSKALVGAGDAYLIAAGDYSSRCVDRAPRFSALASALAIDGRLAAAIEKAYRYKLNPQPAPGVFRHGDFVIARAAIAAALRQLAAQASASCEWELAVAAALDSIEPPGDMERRAILEKLTVLFRATAADVIDPAIAETARQRLADAWLAVCH